MRILHIDNSVDITGAHKALKSWCMVHPEHEHIWVLPEGSAMIDETQLHYKTYSLRFAQIGKSIKKVSSFFPLFLMNASRINKIVQLENIDVIHMNDFYNIFPYFIKKRKLVEFWVHGRFLKKSYPSWLYNFFTQFHIKRANKITVVSRAVKKDWLNHPKVQVIYDPVCLIEKLPRYQFSWEPNTRPFRFLYLANYIHGKGQDFALKAIEHLIMDNVNNFHVDFYGSTMALSKNSEYKDSLIRKAAEKNIQQYVSFFQKELDVEYRYKQYDGVIHFSEAESFCMVVYEALYYRLPLISTDCGGPDEMIINGETGLLVPVGDIIAMAEAMKLLLKDSAIGRSMSIKAGDFIRKYFPSNRSTTKDETMRIITEKAKLSSREN